MIVGGFIGERWWWEIKNDLRARIVYSRLGPGLHLRDENLLPGSKFWSVLDFRGAARDFSHLEKTDNKSLECNVKNLLLFNKWIRHEFCFKLGCLTGKEVSYYSFILTGSLSCAELNLMGANISTLLWLYRSQILVVAWLPQEFYLGWSNTTYFYSALALQSNSFYIQI